MSYQLEPINRSETHSSMPSIITIADTTRCNLNCIMCQRNSELFQKGWKPFLKRSILTRKLFKFYSYHRNKTIMDLNLFKKIAQETFHYLSLVNLSVAGEPFTNPNFHFELDIVEAYRVKLRLFTNVTLLPKGDRLIRLLHNLSSLIVSFDAASKKTYEQIRKGARFEEVINNIRRFNHVRSKLSKDERPGLIFWFVLMRRNIEELPEYVRLAHSLEADGIGVCHMIVFHKKLENESLTYHKQLANHYLKQAKDLIDSLGMEIFYFPPLFENYSCNAKESCQILDTPCRFVWREAFIEINGDVFPCCAPDRRGLWMGNIGTQSFAEIWNGIRYKSLRRSFKDGYLYPACSDCYQRLNDETSDNASIFLRYI